MALSIAAQNATMAAPLHIIPRRAK